MQLTYYLNKSDNRYVDKNIEVIPSSEGHANPVTIVMLESSSVVNPTFKMKDVDLYLTSNYVYVDTLRRYYFIEDYTLSNGYAYLQCKCDVLSSWKAGLRRQNCIIKRQEHKHDMMQNDGDIPIKQYPAKRCIGKFSTPFDMSHTSFVMGVVGQTQGGDGDGGN